MLNSEKHVPCSCLATDVKYCEWIVLQFHQGMILTIQTAGIQVLLDGPHPRDMKIFRADLPVALHVVKIRSTNPYQLYIYHRLHEFETWYVDISGISKTTPSQWASVYWLFMAGNCPFGWLIGFPIIDCDNPQHIRIVYIIAYNNEPTGVFNIAHMGSTILLQLDIPKRLNFPLISILIARTAYCGWWPVYHVKGVEVTGTRYLVWQVFKLWIITNP